MSGMPLCERSKCKPLGVIMPSSRWCGVRAAPVPIVPGNDANVRATLLSNLDGWP